MVVENQEESTELEHGTRRKSDPKSHSKLPAQCDRNGPRSLHGEPRTFIEMHLCWRMFVMRREHNEKPSRHVSARRMSQTAASPTWRTTVFTAFMESAAFNDTSSSFECRQVLKATGSSCCVASELEDFVGLKMQAVESIQAELSVRAPKIWDFPPGTSPGRRAGFRPDDGLDNGRGPGPSQKALAAYRDRSDVRRQA